MPTGKVKWFNESKGFGFIKGDDGVEVFAHFRQIQREGFKTLKEDEAVEYEVEASDRGPQAMRIRPLES